jgi:hypothetical protein
VFVRLPRSEHSNRPVEEPPVVQIFKRAIPECGPLGYNQSLTLVAQWATLPAMKPVTVLETAPFIRAAADCLFDEERQAFIDYIARKPEAGDLIQGTGGARKVRWARDGGGKSGGVRTIYYYHDEDVPLILLTVYPKNVKDNLTPGEKIAIKSPFDCDLKNLTCQHQHNIFVGRPSPLKGERRQHASGDRSVSNQDADARQRSGVGVRPQEAKADLRVTDRIP